MRYSCLCFTVALCVAVAHSDDLAVEVGGGESGTSSAGAAGETGAGYRLHDQFHGESAGASGSVGRPSLNSQARFKSVLGQVLKKGAQEEEDKDEKAAEAEADAAVAEHAAKVKRLRKKLSDLGPRIQQMELDFVKKGLLPFGYLRQRRHLRHKALQAQDSSGPPTSSDADDGELEAVENEVAAEGEKEGVSGAKMEELVQRLRVIENLPRRRHASGAH